MEDKRIQQLIKRFLDGETRLEEEETLYKYFNGNHVSKELRKYQKMFQWYANGMPMEELDEMKQMKSSKTVRWIMSIAASLLLLVGVGVWKYQKLQEEYAIYEGSYIVRDGKKLTNIKEILPELKAAELQVIEMMEQNNNKEIPMI